MKKIGIIGCSNIAAMSIIFPAKVVDGIEIVAVASREYKKADEFAKRYGINKAYGEYEELMASEICDAVYIALPPALHAQYVKMAVGHSLDVLVEKPMSLKYSDYLDIKNLSGIRKKVVLEGLMIQHHPWQDYIKKIVESKEYGKLKRIKSVITSNSWNELNASFRGDRKLGGGVFLDEGSYWLQFIQKVLKLDFKEIQVKVNSILNDVDWDTEINGKIDEVEIEFWTSNCSKSASTHYLEFEDATVTIKNFFRAAISPSVITIMIEKHTGETNLIRFEPEGYYKNQLTLFRNIDYLHSRILMEQSGDRINWLEKIYKILGEVQK
jgi:predicted dehydrogenase